LVALLGGVVAVQMPRALLLQQVLEAAGGILRVVFRRAPDSRDHSFFIGNKNLSRVKDKEENQDISEISDQIQKNSN
jgi:hypothetical protein